MKQRITVSAGLVLLVLAGAGQVAYGQAGSIVAWGYNELGQCNVPAPSVAVAAGVYHSVTLTVNGSIVAWGDNGSGQCNVPAPNADFVAVAGGGFHNLGLKADGSIVAWGCGGYMNHGQCWVPAPNADFVAVAGGVEHSLGLKGDGSVVAWGEHMYGRCDVPAPNTDFVAVAGGGMHSLGLKANGSIVAWGDSGWGQCNVPAPNANFVSVAGGGSHSLGLKGDGSIVAWGYNGWGQRNVPAPNHNFVAIAAGYDHSLGVKADGSIVAWGRNNCGQCNVPTPNSGFIAVAAGMGHSLGLKADGSVVAWGCGYAPEDYGQCRVPAPNADFVSIAAGEEHSLGLKVEGSIVAWGGNWIGECNVPGPNADFVAVGAGGGHSLGLKANGSILAWGSNVFGQCTIPAPNADFVGLAAGWCHSLGLKADGSIAAWGTNSVGECNVPAPNADFVAVAAGSRHSLGLKADGSIVAWGSYYSGPCTVPVPNANFVAVGTGYEHSLGLKTDGSIVAWGCRDPLFNFGQCNVPAPNGDFVDVAAGGWHSLGLKADGSIVAWGQNDSGQCDVPWPNADFAALAAGEYHSLGLKAVFGDVNVDDRVDLEDFVVFADCLSGPGVLPRLGCGLSRIDGDWDVDLADFAILQSAFSFSPPPPVQITITPVNPVAFPCENAVLAATTTPEAATVTWSQTSGRTASFTPTTGKTTTVTVPTGTMPLEVLRFTATATATGYLTGAGTVEIHVRDFTATTDVGTDSSGAAHPQDVVSLELSEGVASEWSGAWTQIAGEYPTAALSAVGTRNARFIAPYVTETTDLHFEARGCSTNQAKLGQGITGTVTVPIQVANVVFNLPSTITLDQPLDIDDGINPETQQPILTITGAPADGGDYVVLFFSAGNGDLPPGVIVNIDQMTGALTVVAGSDGQEVTIIVEVFGNAGMLARVADTFEIVWGAERADDSRSDEDARARGQYARTSILNHVEREEAEEPHSTLAAFKPADRPPDSDFNFEFRYVAPWAGQIPDFTVRWYPLSLTMPPPNPTWPIEYLELDVTGLTHGAPDDLNVFILDPHGGGIEVMDGAGDNVSIVGTRLLFTDVWGLGQPLPHARWTVLSSYPPVIYWPDGPGRFTDYFRMPVGMAPWYAVVIDDSLNGVGGSFQSLTLRGIAAEPETPAPAQPGRAFPSTFRTYDDDGSK